MQDGKTKLKYDEVRDLLSLPNPEFPKYASQLINLAVWNYLIIHRQP
ncbi:protein of unknown function [Methanocaldococcus lauensis]|nr:protein of unknown function [Methanocaldococcus lauensis]